MVLSSKVNGYTFIGGNFHFHFCLLFPLKGKTLVLEGKFFPLTILLTQWPELHRVLAALSATGLIVDPISEKLYHPLKQTVSKKVVTICKTGGKKRCSHIA